MNEQKVICFGNLVLDIKVREVKRLPEVEDIAVVDDISLSLGGNAGNTAVALKLLNLNPLIVSKIGDDLQGKVVLEELSRLGLKEKNLTALRTVEGENTAVTVVAIREDGNRSFIYSPGVTRSITPDDLTAKGLQESNYLHFSGLSLFPQLESSSLGTFFRRASESGLKICYDTVFTKDPEWRESILPLLPTIDYLFVNGPEARRLTGEEKIEEVTASLQNRGASNVIVKLGERGSYFASSKESFYSSSFDVDIVDTTGAGDYFCAGFIAGLTKGWKPKRCANLANWLGAQGSISFGHLSSLPDWKNEF